MKNCVLFVVLIGLFLSLYSFVKEALNPLDKVELQYRMHLSGLEDDIAALHETALLFRERKLSLSYVQQQIAKTRFSFKKCEYLLTYFDPSVVKRKLNGPPLPYTLSNVPDVHVLQPEGLQVIDELAHTAPEDTIRANLPELTAKLQNNYQSVLRFQGSKELTHRHVFEGIRFGLIRLFTMGLTGFDTPVSLNAIPEAEYTMASMQEAIFAYLPMLREKDPAMAKELELLFKSAIQKLQEAEQFETFDRLAFLTEHINPLYRLLYMSQRKIGVETPDEVYDTPAYLNYHATNLFDRNLLNATTFAGITTDDVTADRVGLGKLLFFDPILSENNQRACASCHDPKLGFSDGQKKSLAFDMQGNVMRNSPTLLNSAYAHKWFYDTRAFKLEDQMQHVVVDKKEFGTDFPTILKKLNSSKEYKQLFGQAFGNQRESISPSSISHALNVYLVSLQSFNSPFDQYVRGEKDQLSESASRGFNLFMGKAACGTCHFAPTFNGLVPPFYDDTESEVLGVPLSADTANAILDTDRGKYANGYPGDKAYFHKFAFKTPTVRNASLTAPYMHNGVYETLEQVVDFYNRGGGAGIGIGVDHQTLPSAPLKLTSQEQSDIIAFMETLTDTTGHTSIPKRLPLVEGNDELNKRRIGGEY